MTATINMIDEDDLTQRPVIANGDMVSCSRCGEVHAVDLYLSRWRDPRGRYMKASVPQLLGDVTCQGVGQLASIGGYLLPGYEKVIDGA